MNKTDAIKAIKAGASLHIDTRDNVAWVCTGATLKDRHRVRMGTAEDIAELPFIRKDAHFRGIRIFSARKEV